MVLGLAAAQLIASRGDFPCTSLSRDPALLAAQVGLGVVFIAYGWQKFTEYGLMALRRRSNR